MRRAVLVVVVLSGLMVAPQAVAQATTYTNPVTAGVVDTFPDPTTVRGRDGYWYAFGTQNPVLQSQGEDGERMLPILRSPDLVTWQYAGQVFTPRTQPVWHNGSRLWAPDIRYVDGRYHVYYSVPGRDTVGLATAPTPTGPWTDAGAVLPSPSGCPTFNIDQALFTDTDGARYLYWGSYDTLCVARMNADATRIQGAVTQVARGRRMEGAFVVKRAGFYYLFYSDAGCCDGAYSGYQVKVGRGTSPTGPFTDDEGVGLMASTSKGGIVATATGNRWIGPGHNGLVTDLSGQEWLVYHGIPADNPDLRPASNGTLRLTRRPMLIDRLDWIGGWPVLRAGEGPSDTPQQAPVTAGVTTFDDTRVGGGWTRGQDPDAGAFAAYHGGRTAHLPISAAPADFRAEADLRVTAGAAALTVAYRDRDNHVAVWLDRARRALVTEVVRGGDRDRKETALPADFPFDMWHHLTVEVRDRRMTVSVDDAPAVQERDLPRAGGGTVGVAARGDAAADNVSAAPLYRPVTTRVPEKAVGELLPAYSDEFNGPTLPATPWQWVRGPAPGVAMTGGALSWPTQNAELADGTNTASVLLRAAPSGDYTVATKIVFAPTQAAQQAGLVLYENDDRYFKLVHSVLPLARFDGTVLQLSEFDKEGERPTTTPPTPLFRAPMFGGPTADTMWLRLTYHTDPANNETEVRASTSRDGTHWVAMGVWTLPTRSPLRIGLVSMNRAGATAQFDYLRVYRG
jgi:arabinan endo-1,5-alpha-L-arabinosidase